ncbi:hypothetical protein J6590_082345 [Homalodisca vitripennis]|nr:hypothetical protein J6590_082345 [Homalodisca vitripennis]
MSRRKSMSCESPCGPESDIRTALSDVLKKLNEASDDRVIKLTPHAIFEYSGKILPIRINNVLQQKSP